MIEFKRVRHAARPSKDLRTPSLFGSSTGPTKHRTTGPRNDLTGILVCRRSAGFTDTFGCHRHLRVSPAFITRPSPPGLARSANCAWRTPVLQTVQGYRHRASSEAHRASPGRSRVPPGTHRNLRVPPERLRAFTGAPSLTDGTFETHRTTRSSTDNLGCPPDDFGRPTGASCSPRASSDAHRNLRVPPESLRRLTEASSSKLAVLRR